VTGKFDGCEPRDIQKIRDTVVAILDCDDKDVVIDGMKAANSFFVVLAIKEIIIPKILNLSQQHREKLCNLKVDYFILDGGKYRTESQFQGENYLWKYIF
jgi:hypothetical protein